MKNLEKILTDFCDFYEQNPKKITSKSRKNELVKYRHAVIFCMRKLTKQSTLEIGEVMNCNYATVIYGTAQAENIHKESHELQMDFLKNYKQSVEEKIYIFTDKKIEDLLGDFFMFFREHSKDYLGLSIEQFIQKFKENSKWEQ